MADDVAERLADDREELASHVGWWLGDGLGYAQLDVDHRVVPVFLDQSCDPANQRRPLQELGPQAENEVANVLDGQMDRLDRSLYSGRGIGAIVVHELGYVLERETDGIHVLDDPIVQVLRDPLPLVDDCQSLELLMQPRVLDGDSGVEGECLDERLVLFAELSATDLVGQVEPAE